MVMRKVLSLILAVAIDGTDSSSALGPTRCSLERPVAVDVDVPPGSELSTPPRCVIDRKPSVGWPGYTRPHGSKKTPDGVGMPATALSPTRVRCHLDSAEWPLLTGGNASLTVDSINGTGKLGLPGGRAVELFALFEPQWGRRPYFRERDAALVLAIDDSLDSASLRVQAILPGGDRIDAAVSAGRVRVPFSLARLPIAIDNIVGITLIHVTDGWNITKSRRLIRHPPPPRNSTFVTWQVDHEVGGGLLADGVPFLAQGWFNGGWNHELDGSLGAKYFAQHFDAQEPSFFERQILNLGGIAQEWGKRGVNFVRFQGQVYPNARIGFPVELTKLYLDLAAQAGVFVIFDCSIDTIAKAGFNGTSDQAWQDLLANLTLVRDHPALAGYYACDDCCHVKANVNQHEYRGIEQIHNALRSWDPYHLFVGSSACPDVWMWAEGLEFTKGAPAGSPLVSDVGLDVVMREAYGGGGPGGSGLSPDSKGVISERASRYYPMTFAASWDMPAPTNYLTPGAFRAALYDQAIHQSKYSMNNFAFDDDSASDRLIDEAFFTFAMEASELRNSWLAPLREHGADSVEDAQLLSVETEPTCTSFPHGKIFPTTQLVQDCGSYGRVWQERSETDRGLGFCAHAVVINPQPRAVSITLTLAGLPTSVTSAQRLFDQVYTVNVSTAGVLTDGLAGMSAAVFRFGCKVTPPPGAAQNIVHNGDFEEVDLSDPRRFCRRGCSSVGQSLYPGVGAFAGWRLMHGNPDLPAVFDVQQEDLRASIRPDTADPLHGRHCLRLNLASTSPAILPIPLQETVYGTNKTQSVWTLKARARSSPAGATVSVAAGGCYARPWTVPGDPDPDVTCTTRSMQPRLLANKSAPLGAEWSLLELTFTNLTVHSHNIWFNISTHLSTGATVWFDSVELTNTSSYTEHRLAHV